MSRLDKATSGLIVYAKNYSTLRQLKEKNNDFEKTYIFKSDFKGEKTTTFKICHDEENQREICGDYGKDTKTHFWFEDGKQYAQIFTGRKHQIRASLSKLGFPIYGDRKYGGKPANRVYLHSYKIKFKNLSGDLKYLDNSEFYSRATWSK